MKSESVVRLVELLPARFLPERAVDGRWRVHVGRGRRDVVVRDGICEVVNSGGPTPDAEILTDHATWRAIDEGRLSGIEAFVQRRLKVRGSIDHSLLFEPMFSRPDRGGLRYSLEDVRIGSTDISTLTTGDEEADPLLLVHGLGAGKASWITVIPQLASRYRVIIVDLPGFGRSSKPSGRYDPAWFSGYLFGLMDRLGLESAYVAGNSMGGKIAIEMALLDPARVRAIACLCPATAFADRPWANIVRLTRPELGVLALRLPRARIGREIRGLYADPGHLDDSWFEAAIDEFLQIWRSPRARTAFFKAARHMYLEEPEGEAGYFKRLGVLEPPSLFVFGEQDRLITHHFGPKLERALPRAKVQVWSDCGHVPQLEFPERTAETMIDFFDTASGGRAVS
jgi:pimeloyl-ACP methyl ester carboxylesterase